MHDAPASVPAAPPASAPASAPAANPFGFASAHLLGIGGAGMSALARALMANGVAVSGTDLAESDATRQLVRLGARIAFGHDAANLGEPEAVIASSAIRPGNPEMDAAAARGIPVLHRSEGLARFLASRRSILVTGAHGKTTTTSILGMLLDAAGFDPWVFSGARVEAFDGNTRVGGLEWAVAEADESDGTFERLPADHLVITNIDDDHLDYWKTSEALRAGYQRVVENAAPGAAIVACFDDPGVRDLAAACPRRLVSYGLSPDVFEYGAEAIGLGAFGSSFTLTRRGRAVGRFAIGAPGLQNVSNAVGSLALAMELGADPEAMAPALEAFRGAARRFDIRGARGGVTVVDDYAHHPREVAATLAAGRRAADAQGGRLVAVFQPHRYTRTRDFLDAFGACFAGADLVALTEVYAAGEPPIPGADAASLAASVRASLGIDPLLVACRAGLAAELAPRLRADDFVMTLGAGDIWKTGLELLDILASNPAGDR